MRNPTPILSSVDGSSAHHGARAWPVVGGLAGLSAVLRMRDRPFEMFGDLKARHGSVFELRLPGKALLVAAGAEANVFFAQHGELLSNREQWHAYESEMGATPLNMEEGERHLRRRRFLGHYYHPRTLLARLPDAIDLLDARFAHFEPGDAFSVVNQLRGTFNDQLGMLLTGAPPDGFEDDLSTFVSLSLAALAARTLPQVVLRLPRYKRAKQRVQELSQRIIDAHRRAPSRSAPLVAALCNALGDPVLMPDERALRSAVLAPFIAGMHTAANTAALALHALARRPALMQRIRAEVDEAWADGVSAEQLKRCPTLRFAIMETMRRYPITPAIQRTLAADAHFSGCTLPKGRVLTIATSAAHFDPTLYTAPERFDVERFAAPRSEHTKKGAFAPFGLGAHRCLGASLAELQLMVALARLIQRFEFEVPGRETPEMSFIPSPAPSVRAALRITRVRPLPEVQEEVYAGAAE